MLEAGKIILYACLLATGSGSWRPAGAEGCGFSLAGSENDRITVRFELPAWRLELLNAAGTDLVRLRTECGEDLLRPGFPVLPQFKALVALPPGSRLTARWSAGSPRRVEAGRIVPPQRPPKSREAELEKSLPVTGYSREYSAGGAYPAQNVEVLGPKRFRDLMVAEILIRPFRSDPSSGTLQVTETFQVTLDISNSLPVEAPLSAPVPEDESESFYRGLLLNYDSARTWRIQRRVPASLSAAAFPDGEHWVSLRIRDSNMYTLTGETLARAGVELKSVDPSTLRLYTGGGTMLDTSRTTPGPQLSQVAIRLSGTEDGTFDPPDRLIFYGEGPDRFTVNNQTSKISSLRHRYDNYSVYWLSWDGGSTAALRMAEINPPSASGQAPDKTAEIWYHWEENTEYLAVPGPYESSNPAPDYWAWMTEADKGGITERSFDLELAPESQGHYLRYQFYNTLWDQLVSYDISLNGTALAGESRYFAGPEPVTGDWLALTQASLPQKENNRFTLRGEGQALGFFELRVNSALSLGREGRLIFHKGAFPVIPSFEIGADSQSAVEVFEITDPAAPVHLGVQRTPTGDAVFTAPEKVSSVRSFAAVADGAYRQPELVRLEEIRDLRSMSGAEYLVLAPRELDSQARALAALRSGSYSTATVAVEDIYNEFSWGQVDPVAVRNFLKFAFDNWPVRPRFVVFFGDGHNDFRGVTAEGRAKANFILPYITDSDLEIEEWFVRVVDNDLPQFSLGRLPVQNQAEAEVVLDKIARYEAGADAGDWLRRVILVADDGYLLGSECDPVTNHVPASEALDSLFPREFERRKIYLDEYPFDPPGIGTRKPAANEALIEWWNRGALVVNYLGHGSEVQWAQERVLDADRDLPLLSGGYRLPLVLNSSCSIGHFDDYKLEALAERLLRLKGGGAVAVFAGTRITFAFQNEALNKKFVYYLFAGDGTPVGMAHLSARLNLDDLGNAERYALFGDPALKLHVPGRRLIIEIDPQTVLKAGNKVSFSGRVESEAGAADAGFSGLARIKFLSGARLAGISYQCRSFNQLRERSVNFVRTPAVLFDGPVTVAGGRFSGAFVIPVVLSNAQPEDTSGAGKGLFIGYATSDKTDAAGGSPEVSVIPGTGTLSDTTAPRISLFSNGKKLADGDRVTKTQKLELVVRDENGVNTTGRPGEQLTVEVDDGLTWAADLTPLFGYRTDSYQEGTVSVDLGRVGDGLHSFRFRATDNALNTARLELMLYVQVAAASLSLSSVVNYPNPFREKTSICFEISAPAEVLIRIFSVAGRPVRELHSYAGSAGFNSVPWDGRDEYQQRVANGVYLYKIICKALSVEQNSGTQEVEAIGKALLSR